MKKAIIAVLFLVSAGLIGGFYFASKKIEELPEMNQAFFDEHISNFMASDKVVGSIVGTDYEIKDLKVVLLEEDLKVRMDINAKRNGYTALIDVSVTGYPDYRNGGFYFIIDEDFPPEFHDVDLGKVDSEGESFLDKVKKKKDSLLKKDKKEESADNMFDRFKSKVPNLEEKFAPVIKEVVTETVANVAADKQLLKDASIKIIAKALRTFPIYKLGDSIPESAAAIAIKSVDVENYILKIEISFWNLAIHLLIMLAMGILCLAIVFMAAVNPGAFAGMAVLGALSM